MSEGYIKTKRLSTIGHGENQKAEYEATPKDIDSDAAEANMRVLFEIELE